MSTPDGTAETSRGVGRQHVADVDRRALLTARLEREAARGYTVETRSETQAVIIRSRRGWRRFRTRPAERLVLSVDENGVVSARAAEPVRW